MHRIDGPTAAAALPAPLAVTGTPGYFAHGDLGAGVPYTTPSPDWANAIQEEICAVVEAAGLVLDKGDHGQLLAALSAMFVGAAAPAFTHSGAAWRRVGADGFIECGDVYSSGLTSEGAASVVFATAFPNACLGFQATTVNSGASTSGDTTFQIVSLSATTVSLFVQDHTSPFGDANGGFRWRAWGY